MATDNLASFKAQLERLRPGMARAFFEAVADIRSTAQLSVLEDAIRRGDVAAALRALQLGAEFYAPLDRAISDSFLQGALWQVAQLPGKPLPGGAGLTMRFNGRNERAEQWTRTAAARLVREISEDQAAAIRQTILAGLESGRNPRSLAQDIVGRTEGNQRVGGIVGLTRYQAGHVTRMRAELADPERVADALRRARRDRRFDPAIRAAIREGRALSQADINRIAGRYSERLLALRGETIGRTETLRALNAGRAEAMQQLIDSGQVPVSAVTKIWRATPSGRTRDTHMGLDGQEVRFDAPFRSESGALMNYPGDPSLGAGPEELINCRCSFNTRVNYAALAV